MSAMVSAASSSMARGAAPVISVALTRSFSEKISRFSVMLIVLLSGIVWTEKRVFMLATPSGWLTSHLPYEGEAKQPRLSFVGELSAKAD